MVVVQDFFLLLFVFFCGLFVGKHLRPRAVMAKKADAGLLPWFKREKPEPRQTASISPVPRYPGSWRKQRKDLERQHNSAQKERDQRVAPAL